MTDSVYKQLHRIQKEETLSIWTPITTATSEAIAKNIVALFEKTAKYLGFENYAQVCEVCGRESCQKFLCVAIYKMETEGCQTNKK